MSELAAKLARRRALNGEADPVNDVTSVTSHVLERSAQALQGKRVLRTLINELTTCHNQTLKLRTIETRRRLLLLN